MASIEHQKLIANKKKDSDSSSFELESDSGSGVSHQNSECVKREKKQKLKRKKRRIYSTKSKGNWDLQEDVRFMTFMVQNRQSFENRDLRRSNKIFKKMARFIKTRCPEQCRSHHQKYEKKYATFDQIVTFIQDKARRGQQRVIKAEENKDSKEVPQAVRDDKNREQKINSQKQKGQGKNQMPTVAPVVGSEFSLHQEDDGYNILLAFEPVLEVKVLVDVWNLNIY